MILAKFHQLRMFLWTTRFLGVAFLLSPDLNLDQLYKRKYSWTWGLNPDNLVECHFWLLPKNKPEIPSDRRKECQSNFFSPMPDLKVLLALVAHHSEMFDHWSRFYLYTCWMGLWEFQHFSLLLFAEGGETNRKWTIAFGEKQWTVGQPHTHTHTHTPCESRWTELLNFLWGESANKCEPHCKYCQGGVGNLSHLPATSLSFFWRSVLQVAAALWQIYKQNVSFVQLEKRNERVCVSLVAKKLNIRVQQAACTQPFNPKLWCPKTWHWRVEIMNWFCRIGLVLILGSSIQGESCFVLVVREG